MKMGGGTLIAIHRTLTTNISNIRPLPVFPDAEITQINISLCRGPATKDVRLFCCYFPQNVHQVWSQMQFFEHLSDLHVENPTDVYLVVGDFNIRNAEWEPNPDDLNNYVILNPGVDQLTTQLSSFLCFTGWSQFNCISNMNNRFLDLVISSSTCSVSRSEPLSLPEDNHHPALNVNINVNYLQPSLRPPPRLVRRFHTADYSSINIELAKTDWDACFSGKSVEEAVTEFYTIVNLIIDKFIPSRLVINSSRYPIWYSRPLIKLVNKKLKLHKKWKIYGRQCDYILFSELRREFKNLEASCYNAYIERAEANILTANSKCFWSFVKSKQNINSIPDSLYLDTESAQEGQRIADLFNKFFESVFQKPSATTLNIDALVYPQALIGHVDLNHKTVEKYLSALNTTKGSGPDGLHPLFIKRCSKQLAIPLTLLFQLSLRSGILPKTWKRSIVVPIHKNGDKHNIRNYRGISKLSVIPKLFEKIIYDALFPAVRPLLTPLQHGFINKRSTETNLCELLDVTLDAMDKGFQVDAVYTDYSKAFDKISHDILIVKLEAIESRRCETWEFSWIVNYYLTHI
ncbi:uncharacterized protein LOC123879834 [Maniola jurtina]|uniref:uncharacterized protein LOC123879834 n=1 Tax=Maniola jurtina TaxID=191418 RepID=UPI001E68F888|nr:uncharacterized protein LOC123879834 [Maniola jurtina]